MPHLERGGGVRIFYEQHGPADGPAILFTHGYSASSTMWADQLQLAEHGFHVITWDIRGHQFSDSPDSDALFAKELSIGDMEAVLSACGVERAAICGHSMGGFLSFEFLLAHPERCSSLILFGSGPGYRDDKARDGWNRMAIKMGENVRTPSPHTPRTTAATGPPVLGRCRSDHPDPGPPSTVRQEGQRRHPPQGSRGCLCEA